MIFERWSRLVITESDTHYNYRVYLRDARGEYVFMSATTLKTATSAEAFAQSAESARVMAAQSTVAPATLNAPPQGRANPFS
jgi:hypothetical protein